MVLRVLLYVLLLSTISIHSFRIGKFRLPVHLSKYHRRYDSHQRFMEIDPIMFTGTDELGSASFGNLTISDLSSFRDNAGNIVDEEDKNTKTLALDLLDCLTCTKDVDSPEYDVHKDIRRDELLLQNDYSALKVELRIRGLSTSGDKLEMMIRLLLSIVDPSVKYSVSSGREVELKYIDDEDIKSNKARIIPEDERESDIGDNGGPDAEDLHVLRKRRTIVSSTGNGGEIQMQYKSRADDKPKIVMDGMVRKEISFATCHVKREERVSRVQDDNVVIRAYVVGGRDVLRSWTKTSTVVVLLPDASGWSSKKIRIIADEVAFYHQSIVCVPDIYRGYVDGDAIVQVELHQSRVFDDIIASLQFARTEYDSKAISIAGIGLGGSLALQAACDLSDISAYAVASSNGKISYPAQTVDPYYVMQRANARIRKREEKEVLTKSAVVVDNGDSKGVDSESFVDMEGIGEILAGIDDGYEYDEEDEEEEEEVIIKPLTSEEVASKVMLSEARGQKLLSTYPSIPFSQIPRLCPLSAVAWMPTSYDAIDIGSRLQTPCYIVSSGSHTKPSPSYHRSIQLHDILQDRVREILDFSFRSYEVTNADFMLTPNTTDDIKATQDAVLLGSYWMDIYSRYAADDYLTGVGNTKHRQPFMIIRKRSFDMQDERSSPIAAYLHDEPDLFTNSRLPSDKQLQMLTPL